MLKIQTKFFKRQFTNTDVWVIPVDITHLRDFTAFDKDDMHWVSKFYEIDENTTKNLLNCSDTEFSLTVEGIRKPVYVDTDPFKLGRILAKNENLVELDTADTREDILQEITNGMMFEYSQEKVKSGMISTRTYKFKVKYGVNDENNKTSTVDQGSQANIQIWV